VHGQHLRFLVLHTISTVAVTQRSPAFSETGPETWDFGGYLLEDRIGRDSNWIAVESAVWVAGPGTRHAPALRDADS
jgi:hypothetical protein